MNKELKVSIITVCYNSVSTLQRTIESIAMQDYPNIEYIVVDGGSTDGTLDVILKNKNHISKWVSEADNGISDAFNKGILMSSGEIIGLINADDGLEPGAISALVNAYEPGIDVYKGNIFFINEDSGARIREIPSMHSSFSGWNLRLCHQGTFVTKKAYEKYGLFDTSLKYNMDYDLLVRYERAGAKFKYVDYDIAYFTMNGITFSGNTKDQQREMIYIIKKNGGKKLDIFNYKTLKKIKMAIKKLVKIDTVLLLKNHNAN